MDEIPASRRATLAAYTLAVLTTLLWVGCVLPSGPLADGALLDEAATPFFRQGDLLVPALLLLIVLPVGFTLVDRRDGGLTLLACTDAFLALYAAIAVLRTGWFQARPSLPFIGALGLLLALSIVEAIRCIRPEDRGPSPPHWLRGIRLAICLLVLMAPAGVLVREGVERGTMLAPFLAIAVSAGGALMGRHLTDLRMTAGLLLALLSAYVVVTLRFTVFEAAPPIAEVSTFGHVTLGLAWAVLGVAILQFAIAVLDRRRVRAQGVLDASVEAESPAAV